jgi:hypothetical protein
MWQEAQKSSVDVAVTALLPRKIIPAVTRTPARKTSLPDLMLFNLIIRKVKESNFCSQIQT